jgi:predicted regulator of Ras-like GTPase activity (Roadblock/LC7/MglB family)
MMPSAQNISTEAQRFNWLLGRFASDTPGVMEAIAVSSDGLLIAMSAALARADADRLAAIVSAISSLAMSVSHVYDFGLANKVIIDLDRGYLLVSTISACWRGRRRTSAASRTRWRCSPTAPVPC